MAPPGIDPDPDGEFRLYVDVVDKPAEILSNSAVTEAEAAASNVGHDKSIEQVDCSNLADVSHDIDWESLLITPLTEDQIGTALPVMDEDAVYEFVGLRAKDERAEQARMAAQQVNEINLDDVELQDADLLVHDHVPGEDSFFHDTEDPPMEVGTIYSSMDEFRAAVRQHAIKGQFQLVTKKSRPDYFNGKCAHVGCSWTISARLIRGDQQVRVAVNKGKHFCPSTKELITKMASYKWVRDKSIPYLKKDPNMLVMRLLSVSLQLTMGELGGTDQINISPRALTLSETGEGPSNAMTTPRKSPRKRLGLKKKITPRKGKTMDA